MKVIDNVFDEMTSYPWLLESYHKARAGKRYRPEVMEFASDLDSNLLRIQEQLRDGTFQFGPYRRFWVSLPKRRAVTALPFDSRIAQWAVYRVLNPFYRGLMIEDSYACLDGRGSIAAANRLQYWLRLIEKKPGDWYCLKLDVSKFFYRIDHEILISILQQRIKDDRLMQLLQTIINSGERFGLPRFAGPETGQWIADKGMPIGNLTSQLFANIYLNELDQYCKHQLHLHCYIRYMDDVIILTKDRNLREPVEQFLYDRLLLDLNKKTALRPAGQPIEFVGYIVTPDTLRLRKSTARRMKRSWKVTCTEPASAASYAGIMKHTDNAGLRYRMNEIYLHEMTQRGG